jgi:hypothetical protein
MLDVVLIKKWLFGRMITFSDPNIFTFIQKADDDYWQKQDDMDVV